MKQVRNVGFGLPLTQRDLSESNFTGHPPMMRCSEPLDIPPGNFERPPQLLHRDISKGRLRQNCMHSLGHIPGGSTSLQTPEAHPQVMNKNVLHPD